MCCLGKWCHVSFCFLLLGLFRFLDHQGQKSVKADQENGLESSQYGLTGLLKGAYQETDCPPLDDADLQSTSLPLDIVSKIHTSITTETNKLDKPLLDSLAQVGFKHDPYPEGLAMKYYRYKTFSFPFSLLET